jgi:hypothetical protein
VREWLASDAESDVLPAEDSNNRKRSENEPAVRAPTATLAKSIVVKNGSFKPAEQAASEKLVERKAAAVTKKIATVHEKQKHNAVLLRQAKAEATAATKKRKLVHAVRDRAAAKVRKLAHKMRELQSSEEEASSDASSEEEEFSEEPSKEEESTTGRRPSEHSRGSKAQLHAELEVEQAAKEAARKLRQKQAQQRAAERRAEKAAQELAQGKAYERAHKWANAQKLSACQEECRRRGIWPGGSKIELVDRIARAECGETLAKEEMAQLTKYELLEARERKHTVARVLQHRVGATGRDEFLVRWKPLRPGENAVDTWEPRGSFDDNEMLRRWDEDAADKVAAKSHQRDDPVPQSAAPRPETYTAKNNEVISRIALKLGCTAAKLVDTNLQWYPDLRPSSKLRSGTELIIPLCAKRQWKQLGHGWLGRVVLLPYASYASHNGQPKKCRDIWPPKKRDQKRSKRAPSCDEQSKNQRWRVAAWSTRVNEMEPLWRLVNEDGTEETELLEAEMVETIVGFTGAKSTPGSSTQLSEGPSNYLDLHCSGWDYPGATPAPLPQSNAVEFGTAGPQKADLDPADGHWLLTGSQWLGRCVKRTFHHPDVQRCNDEWLDHDWHEPSQWEPLGLSPPTCPPLTDEEKDRARGGCQLSGVLSPIWQSVCENSDPSAVPAGNTGTEHKLQPVLVAAYDGRSVEVRGRVVAYKPGKRGYVAVSVWQHHRHRL